jgi:hypothetical protein
VTALPEAVALPTRYVVSCLPEGHDDRHTFTINVHYRGDGQYGIKHLLRYYATDGTWSYDLGREEAEEVEADWRTKHLYDLDTALCLAKQLAQGMSYRGRTVADVLAEGRHG